MEWIAVFTVALTVAMLLVMVIDTVAYVIPNWLNLALLALYPLAAVTLGLDWQWALLAAAMALAIGMGMFALGLMGGGDIKLLVILILWIGWRVESLQFIFMTAIMGGLLVGVVMLARFALPGIWRKLRPTQNLPRVLTAKQPVPYGIAIAAAFLWMLHNGQVLAAIS